MDISKTQYINCLSSYLPASNVGHAIGDISVLNIRMPSVGLSWRGRPTSADTLAATLYIYIHGYWDRTIFMGNALLLASSCPTAQWPDHGRHRNRSGAFAHRRSHARLHVFLAAVLPEGILSRLYSDRSLWPLRRRNKRVIIREERVHKKFVDVGYLSQKLSMSTSKRSSDLVNVPGKEKTIGSVAIKELLSRGASA